MKGMLMRRTKLATATEAATHGAVRSSQAARGARELSHEERAWFRTFLRGL
jgi:hypothetical protein